MKIDQRYWRFFKTKYWNRLWEDLEIGYLDKQLLQLLIRLNMDLNIYTMSSCSGRVVFSDSTYPWSREETSIVFKKHGFIDLNDILNIIGKKIIRRLWVNVSGPIIHLSVSKPSYVKLLLNIAHEAGLKHSGLISINKYKGFIIELMSGVKLSHLLKTPGKYITDTSELETLVNIINEVLVQGEKYLNRLREIVNRKIPIEEDVEIIEDVKKRGIILY